MKQAVMFLTAACLIIGAVLMMQFEGLCLVDALYYSAIILSSIGFGDIVPTTVPGRVVTAVLALVGMGVFADLVTVTGKYLKDIGKTHVIVEFLLCITVGSTAFAYLEGVDLITSVYFVLMMSTTIGHGDVVPVTTNGRLFCVVYALWSLHCMAQTVNLVKELLYELLGIDNSSDGTDNDKTEPNEPPARLNSLMKSGARHRNPKRNSKHGPRKSS